MEDSEGEAFEVRVGVQRVQERAGIVYVINRNETGVTCNLISCVTAGASCEELVGSCPPPPGPTQGHNLGLPCKPYPM